MKKTKRWLLIPIALLAVAVTHTHAVAPFKKVSIATTQKSPASTASALTNTTAAEGAGEADDTKHENAAAPAHAKNSKLTGIPQIDYIWDPNLPRELRGYNLSSYPFLSTVPTEEDIHFKCDGLHDGFYASIEYKCQVYHHCVYGIRHDFLCANFTAFDQKTFICHFVSDVDCEGSQKYWNRNDLLYMATTTSTTSTTTTEPPPTARRRNPVRPLRPLRRPMNRRPIDDYYYEEEEYDDDYYEERLNRKRKQRPRQRKPIVEYEDEEYEEKRSFDEEEARPARRPSSRDRFRDDDELEEYDNPRRKYDRSKGRAKPTAAAAADRRKSSGRKPGTILSRGSADERRSFSDDRAKEKVRPVIDDVADAPASETHTRRLAGRNRLNEKRSTSPAPLPTSEADDELDDDSLAAAQEHVADDDEVSTGHKVRTTAKPLDEFVTPKAGSSVYARPRAPPRIARPVPVTEKKKFQYPVQKTGTTTAHPDEDYYQDEEYEEVRRHRGSARRRVAADETVNKYDEDDLPVARRRTHNSAAVGGKKPGSRGTIRKPSVEKKPSADDDDYDNTGSASNERYDTSRTGGVASRRRPHRKYAGRGTDDVDVDFVDDDYEERPLRPAHRLRPKAGAIRKAPKKPYKPIEPEEEEVASVEAVEPAEPPARPLRGRAGINRRPVASGRRSQQAVKTSTTTTTTTPEPLDDEADAALADDQDTVDTDEPSDADADVHVAAPKLTQSSGRPASAVRVVKRPFLPSRGGSPYLPRGLQPVGVAHKIISTHHHTTDSTPFDMGSTISGVRLLEHGAPIVRNSQGGVESLRTTLSPRNARPLEMQHQQQQQLQLQQPQQQQPQQQQTRISLDELYENDYDVTLNDALNPTLKPLSPLPSSYHQIRNYGGEYATATAATQNSFVNNNSNNNNSNNNNYNNNKNNFNYNNNNNNNNKQSPAIYHNNNSYQHQTSAYQSVPHQTLSLAHHLSQPSQSQSQPQTQTQPQTSPPQQHHPQQQALNNYNSDSYFSSTDIRRRAIIPAPTSDRPGRSDVYNNRGVGLRIAQHFYDDFEY